jgi:hypothetical protein
MCVHIFQYASPESILLYHSRDEESGKAYFLVRELYRIYILFTEVVPYEEWREIIFSRFEIFTYSISSKLSEVDDSDLPSLSSYREL